MPRTITHLEIGGPDFTPTVDDLNKIKERFCRDPIFIYSNGACNITKHELPDDGTRYQIWVGVGDPNWQPTDDEFEGIRTAFLDASKATPGSDDTVVVTRNGVQA